MTTIKRIALYGTLALGIITLSSIVTQCYAATTQTDSVCRRIPGGGSSCSTTTTERETAFPAQTSPAELAQDRIEKEIRIRDWEAFCKPTVKLDNLGVSRFSYAHPNCDLGRTQ